MNTTPTETTTVTPTGCCPPFDPSTWHEREVVWNQRPFVKEHVRSVFHIPLGFGRAVTRAQALIKAAGAEPEHGLMLTDEASPWRSELYIDVTGDVPGAEMTTLSGTFLTRVYDGSFRDAPKWAADMKAYVAARQRRLRKLYFAYTTCPRCAKAYGHNYVVLFAQVDAGAN
jgi:hypothetical protein